MSKILNNPILSIMLLIAGTYLLFIYPYRGIPFLFSWLGIYLFSLLVNYLYSKFLKLNSNFKFAVVGVLGGLVAMVFVGTYSLSRYFFSSILSASILYSIITLAAVLIRKYSKASFATISFLATIFLFLINWS